MSPQKRNAIAPIVLSFLLVAAAQPDWSPLACVLTSVGGFALFWVGMFNFTSKKGRFCLATLWFAAVQAVHLNWFMNDQYVGVGIYPVLAILFLCLGMQFGLVSLFLPSSPRQITLVHILGISGLWTLMEWGRLFFLSGFSWNPTGLALSGTLYGMQLASAVGVFGLTFWIFFTNLLALKLVSTPSWSNFTALSLIALTPYFYGVSQVAFHHSRMASDPTPPLRALLVQTSLYPEEKMSLDGEEESLSPLVQWERILSLLYPHRDRPVDLIALSESAVPYGTDRLIYSRDSVGHVFDVFFGKRSLVPETDATAVGNHFWSQAIANVFDSDVVIGLDDYDQGRKEAFNAAFLVRPFSEVRYRYEKRILVPLGEYIPFEWCRAFLRKYGINDSFTPGREAKVFPGSRADVGLSICYEETYGHLMRENRMKGADVLINLTNDVWYPRSRLPFVHFLHGRLRAVEGGLPMLRACNTGVTCGIDSLGRLVGLLDYETVKRESLAEAIYISLPLYTYPTLYVRCGDWPAVLISSFSFCLMSVFAVSRRRRFSISELNIPPLHKN